MVDHGDDNIIGVPTGASSVHHKRSSLFKDLCKVYRSVFKLWHRDKNWLPARDEPEAKIKSKAKGKAKVPVVEEVPDQDSGEEEIMYGVQGIRYHPDGIRGCGPGPGLFRPRSSDNFFPSKTSPLSRSSSRRSPTPAPSSLNRSRTRASRDPNAIPGSVSRNASLRSTNPIMFSNSNGMVKPPPLQKKLDCTLEDLCYGCTKKIKITRDVIMNTGQIIQEEEILKIKVKAGWKEGTKITFEGMGNETPGALPADITFVIAEKRHPLFRRQGDDLELAVRIPLVKALTGCTLSIPLLGGEKMALVVDDIVHPGYERVIPGQGMPKPKQQGKRGNLKIVFLIEFPTELTDEQRKDILDILQNSS